MGDDIDLRLGKRVRRRRRLLGLTQQQVADAVGIRFQQIQKYECGANRMSAARLLQLADAMKVPVSYFYDGLGARDRSQADEACGKETQDLLRAYYGLDERPRRHLLDLAKSLGAGGDPA